MRENLNKALSVLGDDKSQVIFAVTLLGLTAFWVLGAEADQIINNIIAGLLGLAVGGSK